MKLDYPDDWLYNENKYGSNEGRYSQYIPSIISFNDTDDILSPKAYNDIMNHIFDSIKLTK